MTEKQLKMFNQSRMDTMDSSRGLSQVELSYYQMSILNKAIDLSHVLEPSSEMEELNHVRFMFCLEYFFSVFDQTRKITNTERFLIFDKQNKVHMNVLINLITDYKREVGELYRRPKVTITPESVIQDMDKKVLLAIKKIWKQCHDKRFEAIPRENIEKLIERIYTDFNYKKTDVEINQKIIIWKKDVSYFVIFEEFAFLMRTLNSIKKLKVLNSKQNCGGCSIF